MKKAVIIYLYTPAQEIAFHNVVAETFSKCLDLRVPAHEVFYVVNDSCNGLLCLSSCRSIYLWNPSIRKIKSLPIGVIQAYKTFVNALGFGFHRGENDYKVVRVMGFRPKETMFEVEVYNLRLNAWRKISVVPPDVSVSKVECVFLNGVVYWSTMDPSQHSTFILSFDFGSEEFKRIMLPRAAPAVFEQTPIGVFENSLSFFHRRHDEQLGWFYELWILEMCSPHKGICIMFTGVHSKCQISYGCARDFSGRIKFGFI